MSFHFLVSTPNSRRIGNSKTCPQDLKLGALTKWLASRCQLKCLGRLLYNIYPQSSLGDLIPNLPRPLRQSAGSLSESGGHSLSRVEKWQTLVIFPWYKLSTFRIIVWKNFGEKREICSQKRILFIKRQTKFMYDTLKYAHKTDFYTHFLNFNGWKRKNINKNTKRKTVC